MAARLAPGWNEAGTLADLGLTFSALLCYAPYNLIPRQTIAPFVRMAR
ncbi:MAG: hypothetical protein ACI4X9_02780 [Kiritimatiellia bacterium]